MIFSTMFEVGLLVIGFLYVVDMYIDSCIHLVEINHDIEECERTNTIPDCVKHIYS